MKYIDEIFTQGPNHEFEGEQFTLTLKGTLYPSSDAVAVSELLCKDDFAIEELICAIQKILKGKYLGLLRDASQSSYYFSDYFGRSDLFYSVTDNAITLAEKLPDNVGSEFDNVGLTQILITGVGPRPPKKHTIFKEVSKLGFAEFLCIENNAINIRPIPRQKFSIKDFTDHNGEEFGKAFLDILDEHASLNENFLYFSSGWDSTSILACLAKLRCKKSIRPIIARVTINKEDGPFNLFEIEKAKKFTDYYGVGLEIIDIDYGTSGKEIIEKAKKYKLKYGYYGYTVNWHYLVAEHISKLKSSESSVVFSGEISDGLQNFGFSQYVSSLHPDLGFREYADKMRSYLYGPSFRHASRKKQAGSDEIAKFFKPDFTDVFHETIVELSDDEQDLRLLNSFFSSLERFPFSNLESSKILTKLGSEQHVRELNRHYFNKYLPISDQNWYSTLIELYSSFHWNGSSVNTLYTANEEFNNTLILPFYDERLVEYFSKVPEKYGRGLDLHKTKHFLKNFLSRDMDYPLELQEGPHSYLYDVDGRFINPNEGYVYGSLYNFYTELLDERFLKLLNPQYFDVAHLSSIISQYKSGERLNSNDFQLLLGWLHLLSTHS